MLNPINSQISVVVSYFYGIVISSQAQADEKSVTATIPANKDLSSGKKRRIRNDNPTWLVLQYLVPSLDSGW